MQTSLLLTGFCRCMSSIVKKKFQTQIKAFGTKKSNEKLKPLMEMVFMELLGFNLFRIRSLRMVLSKYKLTCRKNSWIFRSDICKAFFEDWFLILSKSKESPVILSEGNDVFFKFLTISSLY